jgi:hypothetical protein
LPAAMATSTMAFSALNICSDLDNGLFMVWMLHLEFARLS